MHDTGTVDELPADFMRRRLPHSGERPAVLREIHKIARGDQHPVGAPRHFDAEIGERDVVRPPLDQRNPKKTVASCLDQISRAECAAYLANSGYGQPKRRTL